MKKVLFGIAVLTAVIVLLILGFELLLFFGSDTPKDNDAIERYLQK